MVNIGILYAITAGVGALTIAVLQNRLLATEHKDMIDRDLVFLFGFFVVFSCVDMIWGALSSRLIINDQILFTVFTYGFHLGSAFSSFFWSGYLIDYLHEGGKSRKVHNCFRGSLIVIQLTVLVSNLWNRRFFWVDEEAYYHSYVLRNFMFFMQFAYYIVWIVYISYELIRNSSRPKEDFDRRRHLTAMVFCLVPLGFGFGQMLWPDAPMYSLGFMLTAVLIYSINATAEREDFISSLYKSENDTLSDLVAGLSYDCQLIFHVDLSTGKYTLHANPDSTFPVPDEASQTGDFFRDTIRNVQRDVAVEDQDYVLHMLTRDNILRELSDKRNFSFNFLMNINGQERHYLSKVVRTALEADAEAQDNARYNVIVGLFDDDERVREEIRQKDVLREAIRTAEKASRAKSDFLFNMSHDIRTPMNAILGFTSLAQRHLDDPELLKDSLDKVASSGQHLLTLINDVLDMSRIESGKLSINVESESVVALSEQLSALVQELTDTREQVFTHEYINLTDEYVLCDALRLKQVILNVLSNAVKYTPVGGSIRYTVEQLPSDEPEKVSLCFTVADTGIGMSPEFLARIFNEFEREQTATASGVEGTGLGMSITKSLTDLMGGEIRIDSVQGEGTTVRCFFTFDNAAPVAAEEAEEVEVILPAGKRILLVDDNELNREIAMDLLEDLELEVEEAADGTEAVEKVSAAGAGYYDAVLMDVQMPKMNGYEATRRIRALPDKALASVPIIAMTANAFEEDKKNAYAAGMNAHLAKPINVDELSATLSRFLRG